MKKLSKIFKEMAQTLLVDPNGMPSSEAAHAALLLVHVAWNLEVSGPVPPDWQRALKVFEANHPGLWSEIRPGTPEILINELRFLKQRRYPEDHRQVLICGIPHGRVRVEWRDPDTP
jgi:hypothetical protein